MIPAGSSEAVVKLLQAQIDERRALIKAKRAELAHIHAEIVGLVEAQMSVERMTVQLTNGENHVEGQNRTQGS